MIYRRQNIDPGPFANMMPDGAKIYAKLELPVLRFKRNNVEYTVTDMRPLNEKAIRILEIMLGEIAENPEIREIAFDATGVEESTLDLINDIITAIEVTAKKKGKNGYEMRGPLLVHGTRTEERNGKRIVTFDLIADNVKPIHEIIKENKQAAIQDIAVAVGNRWKEEEEEA